MPPHPPNQNILKQFPPPPRDVFRQRGIPVPLRILLFCLVPHVWVGVFLIVLVAWSPLLRAYGHDTTATIVKRQVRHSKKSGDSVQITYRYDEAGRQYIDTSSFTPPASNLKPGVSIPVRSLHWNGYGSSSIRTSNAPRSSFGGLLFFAILWNGFVLLLFFFICLGPLREKKLLSMGEIAIGKITGKTVRRGKSTSYLLTCEYHAADGQERSLGSTVPKGDYESAQIGEDVLIFYDPLRPRRGVIYKYSQYRVQDRYGQEVAA